MNVIRQETDYALRLMALLATPNDDQAKSVSTRVLAEKSDVSYGFACKILQKLHEAGLIESIMGPKGGYKLHKNAHDITLLEVISAVQGPLSVNDCLVSKNACSRKESCPLSGKMEELQKHM
ncbi:MAG: Rrf2 family transcriptional regulator, partial [Sedimentisphaerales bacterium]|nr:Rrf2 family transcriptional regulator [Sedimentisphaerales bacterium]